jgi:hypothetical protein
MFNLGLATLGCLLLHLIAYERPLSEAYVRNFKPLHIQLKDAPVSQRYKSAVMMNTDQRPCSTTNNKNKIVKNSIIGISSAFGFAFLNRQKAIAIDLPECSDSVTIFKRQKDNKEIIMIGTAHISEESAKLVRRTIKTVKPDVVMIELDPKRVGKIAGENRTLEEAGFDIPAGSAPLRVLADEKPKAKPGFVRKALESLSATVGVWIQDAGGKLIGRVLSEFYKSVEKLGFVAGGEFKAAVEEGRDIGARILLGDRDVDITLNRLATAVTNSKQENFDRVVSKITALESAAGIELPNDAELSKGTLNSFIESVKQRDLLGQVMGAVKSDLPEVYAALIGERDIFMAEGLATSSGVNIVGVVGMAHMEGIENYLTKSKGFSVVNRNCPPSNPLSVSPTPIEAPLSAQESIYQ